MFLQESVILSSWCMMNMLQQNVQHRREAFHCISSLSQAPHEMLSYQQWHNRPTDRLFMRRLVILIGFIHSPFD
jgi:hypothetical protein